MSVQGYVTRLIRTHHISVTDNLFSQGALDEHLVAVSYAPAAGASPNGWGLTNGELSFGGVDPFKYTGSITYAYAYSTLVSAAT